MGQVYDYDKRIPAFFVCPNGHVVETVCLEIGFELECPDCSLMGRIFEEPVWKEKSS